MVYDGTCVSYTTNTRCTGELYKIQFSLLGPLGSNLTRKKASLRLPKRFDSARTEKFGLKSCFNSLGPVVALRPWFSPDIQAVTQNTKGNGEADKRSV